MADRFDVVPIRVQHEGAIVIRVVMQARTRRAIVAPAGGQGSMIERVDLGAGLHAEGHVQRRVVHRPGRGRAGDPEVRLGRLAETGNIGALLDELCTM